MKNVSKKSASSQLFNLYCAIHVDYSMFSLFGLKLCSLYAFADNGVIEQSDIDSLRNDIIIFVKQHFNDYRRFDQMSLSSLLNYDFNA